jgi:hypothetical protein
MLGILTESTKSALERLAGVTEIKEEIWDREVLSFNFKNSLKADSVKVVEYKTHPNHYIIEFRKDKKLIHESIIKSPQEFIDRFENVTGIYISYI